MAATISAAVKVFGPPARDFFGAPLGLGAAAAEALEANMARGHTATGPHAYLGRYHNQVTVLREGRERELEARNTALDERDRELRELAAESAGRRISAGHHLAEHREIRSDSEKALGSGHADAEGRHHLIEYQHGEFNELDLITQAFQIIG